MYERVLIVVAITAAAYLISVVFGKILEWYSPTEEEVAQEYPVELSADLVGWINNEVDRHVAMRWPAAKANSRALRLRLEQLREEILIAINEELDNPIDAAVANRAQLWQRKKRRDDGDLVGASINSRFPNYSSEPAPLTEVSRFEDSHFEATVETENNEALSEVA